MLTRAHALGGRQMAFGVGSDEDGNVHLLCDSAEGGSLYPEEVSAYVVAELLSAAQAHTKAPISKAVISVSPSTQARCMCVPGAKHGAGALLSAPPSGASARRSPQVS